jgi:ubiquinone/menaquinone biosynthesis C-methylase UbiE
MVAGNETWQIAGGGPEDYERYLVPAIFLPCAGQLVDCVGIGVGNRVLDVACGTGIVARLAARRAGPSGAVVGLDCNEGMLTAAAGVLPTGALTHAPIEWRGGDAAALPAGNATFDVVCCQQGLQFFPDPAAALREMHRVLVPRGRVAVAVWRSIAHNPVFAVFTEILERHAGARAAGIMRSPFGGPGRDDLAGLVREAGFTAVHVRLGVVPVRFPSASEFLRQEVLCSPLAEPVGALDESARRALAADFEQAMAEYGDDAGVCFPMQTWLVTASAGPRGA